MTPRCLAAIIGPAVSGGPANELVLRAATAAYLGRTRLHTESDLRVFLRWCTDQELDPLAERRGFLLVRQRPSAIRSRGEHLDLAGPSVIAP